MSDWYCMDNPRDCHRAAHAAWRHVPSGAVLMALWAEMWQHLPDTNAGGVLTWARSSSWYFRLTLVQHTEETAVFPPSDAPPAVPLQWAEREIERA
jgi:hypothetical protein